MVKCSNDFESLKIKKEVFAILAILVHVNTVKLVC